MAHLLGSPSKCQAKTCFTQYVLKDVQSFMNMFQEREKREQDAIIFLAVQDGNCGRREYFFLEKSIRRQCFETILGISSHRLDKAGAIDRRFKDARDPTKPTTLTASIDSFCMMTYNSLAEPLPHKFLSFVMFLKSFISKPTLPPK